MELLSLIGIGYIVYGIVNIPSVLQNQDPFSPISLKMLPITISIIVATVILGIILNKIDKNYDFLNRYNNILFVGFVCLCVGLSIMTGIIAYNFPLLY
jgi:hypothetical protein